MNDTIERDISEIKAGMAEMRMEIKSAWRRIDEQRALIESVHELALSVRELTGEVKQLRADQEVMRRDIDALKSKPAKRWESLVGSLITALAGGVLAWFIKG